MLNNLQENEIQPRDNSAFYATTPRLDVSKRYKIITTENAVEFFRQRGFYISGYTEAGAFLAKNKGKSRHMVRLRPIGIEVKGYSPEIIISNSHNTYTSLKINIGIYRYACANGLILGDTFFQEKVTHTGQGMKEELTRILNRVNHKFKEVDELITVMKNTEILYPQAVQFIEEASKIRLYGAKNEPFLSDMNKAVNISPTRGADFGSDLWSVFNVVQEKIIKGGFEYSYKKDEKIKTRTTAPIKNLVQLENFNKELFDLAYGMVS